MAYPTNTSQATELKKHTSISIILERKCPMRLTALHLFRAEGLQVCIFTCVLSLFMFIYLRHSKAEKNDASISLWSSIKSIATT